MANSFSLKAYSQTQIRKGKGSKKMKILLAILIILGLEFGVEAKALQVHNHPMYQKHSESGNFESLI